MEKEVHSLVGTGEPILVTMCVGVCMYAFVGGWVYSCVCIWVWAFLHIANIL